MAFELFGATPTKAYTGQSAAILAAQCQECFKPVCAAIAVRSPGIHPFHMDEITKNIMASSGSVINNQVHILDIWPKLVKLKAPKHTPEAVGRRFVEGEQAYMRQSWNAAVSMYRSALDIATKGLDGVPPRQSFYQRLGWLSENGRITVDMKNWADHVRIEGNDALHDPEDFTEEDAQPLRLFTEMFLKYIFEMPGEVRLFRGETI